MATANRGNYGTPTFELPAVFSSSTNQGFEIFAAGIVLIGDSVGPNVGGLEAELEITGMEGSYIVRFGPAADTSDLAAFVLPLGGGGRAILVPGTQRIRVVLPPAPTGGPYRFFFEGTLDSVPVFTASAPLITIVDHEFVTSVLSMRKLFPPNWDLGIRRIESEDFPQ